MSLRGLEPAEGGTATLHRLNEQLDDPDKKSSCLFLQKKVSKIKVFLWNLQDVVDLRWSMSMQRKPMTGVDPFGGNLEIFLGW